MRKFFKLLFLTIAFLLGLIVLLLIIERNKKVALPPPTGNFDIGRTHFEWTDTSRIDTLASEEAKLRELFVWVWYPAIKNTGTGQAAYLPEAWKDALSRRQGLLARFFTRKLSKIKPHSSENTSPAPGKQFPVILIKPGIGANATEYTTYAEELASHGYIVIGSESPYSANVVVFPDGRVVNDNSKGNPGNAAPSVDRDRRLDRLVTIWKDDLRFITNKLEQINTDTSNILHGKINLKRIGAFGHALGGTAAFRFCFTDARCKAGAILNGTPFGHVNENKLSKPFMFFMAGSDEQGNAARKQIQSNIDTVFQQLPPSRVWINLNGARHYNFSDQAVIRERFFARRNDDLGPIGELRGLEITAVSLRTFFDINLKGASGSKMADLIKKYPELENRQN